MYLLLTFQLRFTELAQCFIPVLLLQSNFRAGDHGEIESSSWANIARD